MGKTIKIISTQKIEVIRDLAYVDRTPELAKAGTVIAGDSLMRVNVLKPISYKFEVGSNEVDEPFTFIDPETRKEVSESILSWKGVRHLIDAGVLEAFRSDGIVSVEKLENEDKKNTAKKKNNEDAPAKEPKKQTKKENTKSSKSLNDIANGTK